MDYDKCPGYIQNILNIIFLSKLTANLWPEVEKFISSLDNSIMVSHHPNWNGICWNSIKDDEMLF